MRAIYIINSLNVDVYFEHKHSFLTSRIMAPQIQDILPILRQASAAILAIYDDVSKFNTEIKTDNSPVTDADKRANDIITRGLSRHFPGVPVISEESKHESYDNRKDYSHYFLV